jgi:hypothetical protein
MRVHAGILTQNAAALTDPPYGSSGARKEVGSEVAGVNEIHLTEKRRVAD